PLPLHDALPISIRTASVKICKKGRKQEIETGVQNLSGSAVCDGFLIQFIEPFFVVEEKFPISFVAAFLCEPGQGWFGYIEERGYIFRRKINPLLVMQKEIGDGLFCR